MKDAIGNLLHKDSHDILDFRGLSTIGHVGIVMIDFVDNVSMSHSVECLNTGTGCSDRYAIGDVADIRLNNFLVMCGRFNYHLARDATRRNLRNIVFVHVANVVGDHKSRSTSALVRGFLIRVDESSLEENCLVEH